MAKKKKKKQNQANSSVNKAKNEPFNNPFAALKNEFKKAPKASKAPVKQEEPKSDQEDDQDLFDRAMNGVKPLTPEQRAMVGSAKPKASLRLDSQIDEDLETLAQLADLISSQDPFDLRLTGDFVSGAGSGVGPQLMERLAEGEFPIQDYLDLHGMSTDDALLEVEHFLARCATRNLRHVLLVHGRGLGSPGGIPMIKNALSKVLTHKRLQKRVLAFCTAQQVDGGSGAMYVLLRKWQRDF